MKLRHIPKRARQREVCDSGLEEEFHNGGDTTMVMLLDHRQRSEHRNAKITVDSLRI